MVQAVSHWPVTPEVRVRSHANSCEVNGGPSGTGTGFTLSTSVLPCQYHSTNAPYSSSSTCFSYRITNVRRLGTFTKYEWSFGNRGAGVRKEISPYYIPMYRPYTSLRRVTSCFLLWCHIDLLCLCIFRGCWALNAVLYVVMLSCVYLLCIVAQYWAAYTQFAVRCRVRLSSVYRAFCCHSVLSCMYLAFVVTFWACMPHSVVSHHVKQPSIAPVFWVPLGNK